MVVMVALVASIFSAGAFSAINALLNRKYGRDYLLCFSRAWAAYFLVLLSVLAAVHQPQWAPGLRVVQLMFALASALFFLQGGHRLEGLRTFWLWPAAAAALLGYTALASAAGAGLVATAAPGYLFVGLALGIAGWRIACQRSLPRLERMLSGLSLMVLGAHRADYPFLRGVEWFAPWGFLLVAVLSTLVGVSLLLLFFELLRRELDSAHANLSTLLATTPAGMGLARHGRLEWHNPGLAEMLGWPGQSLAGTPIADLLADGGEYMRASAVLVEQREGGRPMTVEARARHSDGGLLPVQVHARQLDPADPAQGTIFAVTDLTPVKRAEEMLRQMAAGVAHNFNNMLMAISANAQTAQRALEPPHVDAARARELLANVAACAVDGRDVARRLAASAGGEQLEPPRPCDLAAVARRAAASVGSARPDLHVRLEHQAATPLLVRAPQGELLEVLLNLLSNAQDVSAPGQEIVVRTGRTGPNAWVAVRDQGPGLDQEAARHMFEPFFSKKGQSGLGLGLSSSLGVARTLGGDLAGVNHPQGGAEFTLTLPLVPAAAVEPPAPPEALRAGCRVLLVEDEALVAQGVTGLLRDGGCHVQVAASVAEAASRLVQEPPDAVICDYGLPDGTAWDVAEMLTARSGRRAAPPLIVLTGWSAGQMNRPPRHIKPAAIIQKPVEGAVLLAALAQATRQADGGAVTA